MVEVWKGRSRRIDRAYGFLGWLRHTYICHVIRMMSPFQREQLLVEGEVITDAIRKHWIVYIADFFLHAFGCLVFLIAAYYLASTGTLVGYMGNGTQYGAMILVVFVLIFWTSFFYSWTKEYFDVWYVTNMHIIAVNQKEMFTRDEAFMELGRIQDVLFEKNGFFSNILGFGQLRVQSAGTEQEFVIENIAEVEAVAHHIMDIRDQAKGKADTASQP
jgi:uncharacterized membrane protein YdbT with pleckstrin-like domain